MDIIKDIQLLKEKRNAVILTHNYQRPEVQDIADFTGDSLGLSIEASKTKADVIVFCGVYFMAETAKILSPQKIVLIPDKESGCPLADMITAYQVRELKKKYSKAKFLCYVNTPADVKAECDVCCTSANAIDILREKFTEDDEIVFVPDKHLASYAASRIKRHVIIWQGYCSTHAMILPEDIEKAKREHPEAKVMAHPECSAVVLALADVIVSTSGMLKYAKESGAEEFLVATETGMLYPLKKAYPQKQFYPVTDRALCPNMKRSTLEKVKLALENNIHQVELPETIIHRAQKSIQNMITPGRMIEIGQT